MDVPEGKFVGINFVIPQELPTLYATNFVIQATGDEFILNFFEIKSPISLEGRPLPEMDSIDAVCISRVVVSPRRMADFFKAIETNLEKHLPQFRANEK